MTLRQRTLPSLVLLALALASAVHAASELPGPGERRASFDHGWRFQKGELPGAEAPGFADAAWRSLDLPHDWAIEGPFDPKINPHAGALPAFGVAWYRKHFTVPAEAKGRFYSIELDGAMSNAKVYLNGKELGGRPYGYIGFGFDLTPQLVFGGENVVAVRLAPEEQSSRWYPGAGIYRHVWIDATGPVHVAHWGTYVTTRQAGDGAATASIATELRNREPRPAEVTLETAILDAELRCAGRSFGERLGAVKERVPTGVSVGIMDSIPELLDAVTGYLDAGYLRIKLKIEPGWDVEPVRAVRERFGDHLLLQVDANTAYTRADGPLLAALDACDLLLLEQPLDEEDVLGHALLAKPVRTPICLDESIVSARSAVDAIELGACAIVNIKPGRVGGYLEAKRIHDVCLERGVPVWCGGMLETGIGRAPNLALAALPGFTLPGDTSASDRYFARDLTRPFVLDDGHIAVPAGPGIGVEPDPDLVAEFTVARESVPLG